MFSELVVGNWELMTPTRNGYPLKKNSTTSPSQIS